jgi:hypothetical protein
MLQFVTRSVRLAAMPLLLAGVVAGAASAAPAAAARTGSPRPASLTTSGQLNGVAAVSASDVWAVGGTGNGALIEHWNGTAWKQVPSPAPAGSSLSGVAATSASDVWAVGGTGNGALIEHWNGTAWKQVPSPAPAGSSLSGVAATSATNVWAVGETFSTSTKTLVLHWNGTAWKQVPSPSLSASASLSGVAASSASSAWAVGSYDASITSGNTTLIERWNGTVWKRVPSPSPTGNGAGLSSVLPTSARSAWSVGCSGCAFGGFAVSLIERWNGTAWKQVPSPSPAGGGDLRGVAAVSASSAWAVGGYYAVSGASFSVKTLIERWNGTTWKQVPSPSPGTEASLSGVAATSATNAWAVGTSNSGSTSNILIVRWNGTTWK